MTHLVFDEFARVYVSSQVRGHSWKAIAEGQGSGRALLCLWSYGQYGEFPATMTAR